MLVTLLKPNFVLNNEKGNLTQLVRDGWKQVNVIFSPKNSIRGNHFHKLNKEAFYVITGKFKLTLIEGEEKEETEFSEGDMFMISPGQIHIFDYIEDTILVSMYDKGVELNNGDMDIYQ